jgi:predicted HNH restriction endonuclease
MTTCSVRWRPSGGRGEYEYVPAGILEDRDIHVLFDPLEVTIPAEVRGVSAQGKPRLRKFDKNNRQKLHLPPLVVAVARVPEPRREDITHEAIFPLENKNYVLDEMDFDIIDDDGDRVILAPLRMKIRNSTFAIDLEDRLRAIARDLANVQTLAARYAPLAAAITAHANEVKKGINSKAIRGWADRVIKLQEQAFGPSNFGSITSLVQATAKQLSETEEDFYGTEGKTLTRVHAYKERDRKLVKVAKNHYRSIWGGALKCESCGLMPKDLYGEHGESCIEAHHKTPIAELLPDSVTAVSDLAMLCASCHRIVHSAKPILDIGDVVPKATSQI